MPNYDYICDACEAEMDIMHAVDEVKKKCPECGKNKLRRAWSQVAPVLERYSPMHPRNGRGKGNTGKRKK